MPNSVWLIPEGSTPHDKSWPWKRELMMFVGENPVEPLRIVRERGVLVEKFWFYEDLWVAGYDIAGALEEALATAGATDVEVVPCWETCQLTRGHQVWSGSIRSALEIALGLEPNAGGAAFFSELTVAERRRAGV